jgi:hypothetical protein
MANEDDLPTNTIINSVVQKIRIEIQAQIAPQQGNPLRVLGDPGRRVEVGSVPVIPKDLQDPD